MRSFSLCHALRRFSWAASITAAALLMFAPPVIAQDNVVMVYSSRSHYGSEPVFDAFTRETGIQVRFFNGNNNEVLERLKAEGARTQADVFLAVDVGNLWLAREAGLLQPVQSDVLARNIPAHLRDPEGQWFAIAMRARTIVYSTARVKPSDLSTYEALGDAKWKNRLCLRTSTAVYNQSLIATLIAIHGEAGAERIVKGWVANQPKLFTGDTQLLEAIAAGQCDVGITNHYYLARLLAQKPDLPVTLFWADQQGTGTHVNVSGAGVVKNARNRANAIKLLEYLSRPEAQVILAAGSFEFPANPAASAQEILKKFGTFKPQTVGAAAAGQYQAAAVRLADRAGYR